MNELTEFDYSIVDVGTANFLKSKEDNMREIVGQAYTELGRELKDAQDELSKHGYGCFEEWFTSLGFKKRNVYRIIERYNLVRANLAQSDLIEELPVSLSYEIAKPSANEEAKQKVLNGEVTSLKEYKQLEQQLKREQQAREQAERTAEITQRKLEQAENREPEVIEKTVYPEDYDKVKGNYKVLKNSEETLRKQNQELREELSSLEKKIKQVNAKEPKTDYEQQEKDIKAFELEATKSVLMTKIQIDEFLDGVAVTAYRRGAIATASDETKKKLKQGVNELLNFCHDIEEALDGTIKN